MTFPLETWDKGDKIMAVEMVSVSSMSHGQTYFPGFHPSCFTVPSLVPPIFQTKAFFCPVWKKTRKLIHMRMLMTETASGSFKKC